MRHFDPQNNRGQGFVEYGLLLALIAIVCIAAISATGDGVVGVLTPAQSEVGNAEQIITSD